MEVKDQLGAVLTHKTEDGGERPVRSSIDTKRKMEVKEQSLLHQDL